MIEVGTRRRNQPAPPHVVFEALTEPDRDPLRPWLALLDDEHAPVVVEAHKQIINANLRYTFGQ